VFTGLRPCLISHDTFVKQCVTPPPAPQAVWVSIYKGPSCALPSHPNAQPCFLYNKRNEWNLSYSVFFFLNFLMWWHEMPWALEGHGLPCVFG
jgi:hypothetical protein